MKNDMTGEQWKKVKFPFEYAGEFRMEVSSLGRVRSFHKMAPQGTDLKGSITSGYPIIRLKLYTARDEKKQKYLNGLKNQVIKLQKKYRKEMAAGAGKRALKEIQAEIDAAQAKSTAKHAEDTKARTIHHHTLIHRLVAEYFLPKPKKEHVVVAHIDHDKMNNKASNLVWMTHEESVEHIRHSPGIKAMWKRRKEEGILPSSTKLTAAKVAQMKKLINDGVPLRKLAVKFKITETQVLRIKRGINWGYVKAAE
jgi:hypothetical protein